jgi:hypothetical protein
MLLDVSSNVTPCCQWLARSLATTLAVPPHSGTFRRLTEGWRHSSPTSSKAPTVAGPRPCIPRSIGTQPRAQ